MRSSGITRGAPLFRAEPETVELSNPLTPSAQSDSIERETGKASKTSDSKKVLERPNLMQRILGSAGRKALLTGAVAAVMLGASIGTLPSSNPEPHVGAQIVSVETVRHGDELARLNEGLTKVAALLAPLGLSPEDAKGALVSVSASVELPAGFVRSLDDDVKISAAPGARLYARVDEGGITLSMRPGLDRLVDWGIDSRIERITYHFADGSFSASAEGLGPDSWHVEGVEKAVAERFGPMIPEAMRQPGYSPKTDPNLEANFQQIFDLLRPSDSGAMGGSKLASPKLGMTFVVPKDVQISLADGQYNAQIKAGTRFDVNLSLDGSPSQPALSSLGVRISPSPIEISKGQERALMKRLDLSALTIHPGGEITADYELGAEGVVDGLRLLVALTATAAEPRLAGGIDMRSTRLEGARRDISAMIDEEVEPALRALIRSLDTDAAGIQLSEIFGLPPVAPPAGELGPS